MNTTHRGLTLAAMAAACIILVSQDVGASSSGITGRTNGTGGAGCTGGGCHSNQAQSGTMSVGISGPSTLAPGASGTYTVTATLNTAGTGRLMGLNVAASAGALSENVANLQLSGVEITHTAPLVSIGNTGGSGSYSFTYTNPANATNGSSRTLYAAARIGFDAADGGAWRHASNFTVSTVVTQFGLTVSKTGTGAGTVTSSPTGINCGSDCSENYNSGTSVTLVASPAAGSTFAGWSGACTGTGNCSVTMTAARSVTATFTLSAAQQFTLSVTKSGTGTGTVTSSPTGINCGSDCSEDFSSGTSVTLSAAPSAGSTFTGWSGACTGTGTCTVSMTVARSVTASFTLSAPSGTVTFQGLWWNSPEASENGWGVNLTHQADIIFATWFTYDTDGSGMWLVAPDATRTGTDNFTGPLYRTTGPAFNTVPFNPGNNLIGLTQVGTATFTFSGPNAGTFTYTVNGVTQSKPIIRQVFSTPTTCTAGGTAPAAPNYQDLWWNSPPGSENGWGVNLTHQGDILFATWFTYAADGRGQWLVVSNGARTSPTSNSYTGDLLRTRGPAFSSVPWNSATFSFLVVGTATFTFTDANNGTFAYTLDGITQTKPITRQVFRSPVSVCRSP